MSIVKVINNLQADIDFLILGCSLVHLVPGEIYTSYQGGASLTLITGRGAGPGLE